MTREPRDNVIHVAFGAGRGRAPTPASKTNPSTPRATPEASRTPAVTPPRGRTSAGDIPAVTAPEAVVPAPTPSVPPELPPDLAPARSPDDPLADLYEAAEVAKFFGLTTKTLKSWATKGLAPPSIVRGTHRYYTFRDLVALRTLKGLVDQGVPKRALVRALEGLRKTLPRSVRPLETLRVVADGGTVVVVDDKGTFEPSTGQALLDFSVDRLRADVVRVLRRSADPDQRKAAYEHYLDGCRLDEDPDTMERAAESYRLALQLDPSLASAYTNLGNLRFRQGRAEEAAALYRAALDVDDEQPEAHYNLGFLALERDEPAIARPHLERAVALDGAFADAHFNLANALEALGDRTGARAHYALYLELDPDGPFADLARARR